MCCVCGFVVEYVWATFLTISDAIFRVFFVTFRSNAMYGFRLTIPHIHRYLRGDLTPNANPSEAAASSLGRSSPDTASSATEKPVTIARIPDSLPAVHNTSIAHVGVFPVDQGVLKSVRASDVAQKHPRLVAPIYGCIMSLKVRTRLLHLW